MLLPFCSVNFGDFFVFELMSWMKIVSCNSSLLYYSRVHNKRGGGQNKRGSFKDFEKLINGGVKISGGWGQNLKKRDENRIILINFVNFSQHRYL